MIVAYAPAGIESGPPDPKSDTLLRRFKSRFVKHGRTSVDKLALPHILPPFLDSSSNLSLNFNEPIYQILMCPEPISCVFKLGTKCNR